MHSTVVAHSSVTLLLLLASDYRTHNIFSLSSYHICLSLCVTLKRIMHSPSCHKSRWHAAYMHRPVQSNLHQYALQSNPVEPTFLYLSLSLSRSLTSSSSNSCTIQPASYIKATFFLSPTGEKNYLPTFFLFFLFFLSTYLSYPRSPNSLFSLSVSHTHSFSLSVSHILSLFSLSVSHSLFFSRFVLFNCHDILPTEPY